MYDLSTFLTALLTQIGYQLPWLLACVAGLVFFLTRVAAYGKAATLAAAGFGVLLFASVAGALASGMIQQWMQSGSVAQGSVTMAFAVLGVVHSLLDAGALLLFAMAIVHGRQAPTSEFVP